MANGLKFLGRLILPVKEAYPYTSNPCQYTWAEYRQWILTDDFTRKFGLKPLLKLGKIWGILDRVPNNDYEGLLQYTLLHKERGTTLGRLAFTIGYVGDEKLLLIITLQGERRGTSIYLPFYEIHNVLKTYENVGWKVAMIYPSQTHFGAKSKLKWSFFHKLFIRRKRNKQSIEVYDDRYLLGGRASKTQKKVIFALPSTECLHLPVVEVDIYPLGEVKKTTRSSLLLAEAV